MRTTLALDDDKPVVARALARHQGSTLGAVISGLARDSVHVSASGSNDSEQQRWGLPLLPIRNSGAVDDLELVNQLRDELP